MLYTMYYLLLLLVYVQIFRCRFLDYTTKDPSLTPLRFTTLLEFSNEINNNNNFQATTTTINYDTTAPTDSLSDASSISSKRKSTDTVGIIENNSKKGKLEMETDIQDPTAAPTTKSTSGNRKKQSKLLFKKTNEASTFVLNDLVLKPTVVNDGLFDNQNPHILTDATIAGTKPAACGYTIDHMIFGSSPGEATDTLKHRKSSKTIKKKKHSKKLSILKKAPLPNDQAINPTYDDANKTLTTTLVEEFKATINEPNDNHHVIPAILNKNSINDPPTEYISDDVADVTAIATNHNMTHVNSLLPINVENYVTTGYNNEQGDTEIDFPKADDPESENENEALLTPKNLNEVPSFPTVESICNSTKITKEELSVIPLEASLDIAFPDDLIYIESQVRLAKHAIQLIVDEPIFRQSTDAKFIHALCNITNIQIDFSRVNFDIRTQMMSDAIHILTHEKFNIDEFLHIDISEDFLKSITAIQGAPPKDPKLRLTRLLNNIKEGFIKPLDRIRNWNLFSKMFGIFLPPTAFTRTTSSNLVHKAIQQLTTLPFTKLNLDAYTFAVLLNFTGEGIAINCSSPGCCIDLGIPKTLRMSYFKRCNFRLNQVEDHKFGTNNWCSCANLCTNDLFSGDIVCKLCENLTHEDCCAPCSQDTICNVCSDGQRIIWMFNGKYFHINLPKLNPPLRSTYKPSDSSASTTAINPSVSTTTTSYSDDNHIYLSNETSSSIDTNLPTISNQLNYSVPQMSQSASCLSNTLTTAKSPTIANTDSMVPMITPGASCIASKRTNKDSSSKSVGFGQSDQIRLFSVPTITNIHTTRYTLRISMPPLQEDEDEIEALRTILLSIIVRLRQADNYFECLPWASALPDQTPLDLDEIPFTLESIQIFFDRVRYESPAVYTDFRFKHSRQWEHMKQDIGTWLRNRGYSIVQKKLQDERTKPIGWFLFSSKNYDSDSLIASLKRKNKMDVDIRFSTLRFNRGEELGENPPMAHMAWSSEDNELEYRRQLYAIYNRSHDYPLGIMMRFIHMHNNLSPRQLSNARMARSEQGIFTTSIRSITVDTIVSIDWRPKGTQIPCLRTQIMKRKTKRTLHNLFFSVTSSWRSNCFTFVFPLRHEEEATEYIRTLPGRVIAQYGKEATGFFTEEAATKGLSMKYDPATEIVQTEEDCEMDGIMHMILKRRRSEIDCDVDAKQNGELNEDISFWDNNQRDTLDEHTDDVAADNEDNDINPIENMLQEKVIDIRLGDRDDDAGTMRSAATTNSQYGDDVSLDRSSVNSTLPDNDNDSIQSLDGKDNPKKSNTRKEKVMIANIAALREREQEYILETNDMLNEIEELRKFRELFLANNDQSNKYNLATTPHHSDAMLIESHIASSFIDNTSTHQFHNDQQHSPSISNHTNPALGTAEYKHNPSAGTSLGSEASSASP